MSAIPDLTSRVVLVTGAQQGIGKALALACAAAGAGVVINYLDDRSAAEALVETAQGYGVGAIAVAGDVTRSDDIEDLLAAADRLGGVDVLINNAAIFPRADFLAMTEADWDQVLGVNLKGAFLCTQAAARRMTAHGRGGSIINITSGAAFRGSPRGVHYVSSKAGLVGLTRAVAQELAAQRIRVNAIAPGLTDTAQPRYGMNEDELRAAGELIPLGGINQADDLAGLAVFLASEAAARITGQTIHVNGGQFLY